MANILCVDEVSIITLSVAIEKFREMKEIHISETITANF